jgi:hypothetical protein
MLGRRAAFAVSFAAAIVLGARRMENALAVRRLLVRAS